MLLWHLQTQFSLHFWYNESYKIKYQSTVDMRTRITTAYEKEFFLKKLFDLKFEVFRTSLKIIKK